MGEVANELLDTYVSALKQKGAIRSSRVEAAFRKVERHRLLERVQTGPKEWLDLDWGSREHLELVYCDRALLTRPHPNASSTSQPTLVAMMLELLDLEPGMRVLEIGTGTGYNAALMAEIVGDPRLVTTLDIQVDVAEQTSRLLGALGYGGVRVLARDGSLGWAEQAPYDRIVATAACMDLSPHWGQQLAPGGRMLIPLAHGDVFSTPLVSLGRHEEGLRGGIVGYCGFMSLRGRLGYSLWLSEEELSTAVGLLVQDGREPDVKRPLPEGLTHLASGLLPAECWSGNWPARLEFYYYLAMGRRNTLHCSRGVGLAKGTSAALVTSEMLEGYGPQGPDLCGELAAACDEWCSLGRPGMSDYSLAFTPVGQAMASPGDTGVPAWVVERRHFRQVVSLLQTPSGQA